MRRQLSGSAKRIQIVFLVCAGALVIGTGAATAVGPGIISPGGGSPAALAVQPTTAFWSQAPDANGTRISSEYIPEYSVESEVANDFVPQTDGRVSVLSWWGGPYHSEPDPPALEYFDVHFYNDDGCKPGSVIETYFDVMPRISDAGTDAAGFPIYRYDLYVSVPVTAGTTYWVSAQASFHVYPPQWGRQKAVDMRACETMIRSVYFGYPEWSPASTVADTPWDASAEISMEPAVEACCFPDGRCELLPTAECSAGGGTPHGAGTDCDPNTCPQLPTEACCLFGYCIMAYPDSCVSAYGGTPQGPGSVCDPSPCPTGDACCFAGGFCVNLPAQDCTNTGGTPQGAGSVCDPNPCGETEACCFTDGSCVAFAADMCTNFGGQPHGAGSVCDPNPCPQPPPEACCFFNDGHCEMKTPVECMGVGADPQGTGTVCDPNPCPVPGPEACCFDDGHCEMKLADECLTANGASGGSGTSCDPNPCPIVIPTQHTSWGKIRASYR